MSAKSAARRDVEPRERAAQHADGSRARTSGRACSASARVGGEHLRRRRRAVLQDPRADLGLVDAQLQERVVELARHRAAATTRRRAATIAGDVRRLRPSRARCTVSVARRARARSSVTSTSGSGSRRRRSVALERRRARCPSRRSRARSLAAASSQRPLAAPRPRTAAASRTSSTRRHSFARARRARPRQGAEDVGAGRAAPCACRRGASARRCRAARRAAAPPAS